MGKLLIAAVCLFLLQPASRTQEPAADPIKAKITAAKDEFYAERDKAELALIVLLEKKEAAAKQAGDIKSIEAVRAEIDAFRKDGTFPKLVPLTAYNLSLKSARTKLENVFLAAIKSATQADNLEEAKIIHKQLVEFREIEQKRLNSLDPFQINSLWVSKIHTFTVKERDGEQFKAIFTVRDATIRELNGTIKDGKFVCYAKDQRLIKGAPGPDYYGTLSSDKEGPKIDLLYHYTKTGEKANETLHMRKGM